MKNEKKHKIYIFIVCFILIAKLLAVPSFTLKSPHNDDNNPILHSLSNESCILSIKPFQYPNNFKFTNNKICIFMIFISIILVSKINYAYFENIIIDVRIRLFTLISKHFYGSKYKYKITIT